MKDFLLKLHRARAGSQEPPPSPAPLTHGALNLTSTSTSTVPGSLNVTSVSMRRRFCDLAKPHDTTLDAPTPATRYVN